MERVAVYNSGKVREATLNGKKYLVARSTLIVPGVLSGSQGALYYPPEEVAQNVDAWNGMPLVLGHPTHNGAHVSARSPEVVERHGLGYVFNATIRKGRLVAESWFDVEQTARNAPQVLNRLRKGQPVELSTGLFTINHPAGKGAVFNGKAYQYVARSYRPDHLAILVDQPGACSLKDGCGVLAGNEFCANCGGPGSGKPGPCPDHRLDTDFSTVTPSPKMGREHSEYRKLREDAARLSSVAKDASSQSVNAPVGDALKLSNAAMTASKLATSGGARLSGRTEHGRHSSLHKRAFSAHNKASLAFSSAASKLAIDQPEAALKANKAAKAHKDASFAHLKASQELMIVGNEKRKSVNNLSGAKACEIARDGTVHGKKLTKKQKGLFGAKCGESKENNMTGNCGGKGGKPGPCPTATSSKDWRHDPDSPVSPYRQFIEAGNPDSDWESYQSKVNAESKAKGTTKLYDTWKSGGFINGNDLANHFRSKGIPVPESLMSILQDDDTEISSTQTRGRTGGRRKAGALHKFVRETMAQLTSNSHSGDTSMTKKDKMVRYLTANCECWKGKDDAKTLAALPDDKLKALVDNAKRAKEAAEVVGNLLSTLSEDAEQPITANELPTLVANMKGAMKKGAFATAPAEEEEAAMEEPAESDMEEMAGKKPMFMKNAKKKGKYGMSLNAEAVEERAAPTLNAWLESAPPEVRSVIANAQRIENKQKLEIVAELVGNSRAKTKADKEALHKFLMAKPLDELQTLNQLAPAPRKSEPTANALPDFGNYMTERMPDYSGLGEVEEFTANESDEDDTTLEDAPLGIPTVNWAEEAKLALPGRERGK